MPTPAITRSAMVLLALTLTASGCADIPTRPGMEPPLPEPASFGVLEITLSGLTSANGMKAAARSVAPVPTAPRQAGGAQGRALWSLDPLEAGDRRGLQLEPIAVASFTYGERGNGGQRYLSATFRVRNASADSVAYAAPANNVTLVAVATDATIGETPVSRMRRFDGTPAPAALAAGLRPTGAVAIDGEGRLTTQTADVLQAFTEAEVADLAAAAGLGNVFPYGFMVRNPRRPIDRRLDANPADDQFNGVVTLAFRVPLADDPADDPFEISVMMLAVSDTETRITQSFEGQTVCPAGFEERAVALAATTVTLLDGGIYSGILPVRHIAQLRTAGTAAAPIATLPDAVAAAYPPPPAMIDLSDSTGVVPIIWDIVRSPNPDDDPRVYRVRYGYYNPSTAPVALPIGMDNFFVPGSAIRGQPTEYLPGLHVPPNGGFAVNFSLASTPVLNWSLGSNFVSADLIDPNTIYAPPPCGFRT
jgi:hypothetical protein